MNIRYFPIDKGIYEVSPGLRPLGTDLGFGNSDKNIFQIDEGFSSARENKLACRAENLDKYFIQKNLSIEKKQHLAFFFLFKHFRNQFEHFFSTL